MTTDERVSGLRALAFQPLPLGAIHPTGWMRDQLRIQADGLSGHLDEFWPDIAYSGWIGGDAEGWERGPYWLDGVVPLAYLLEDERLERKVQRWIDAILAQQHEDGWFGSARDKRISNPRDLKPGRAPFGYDYDPWPRYVLLKALTQYYEATQDPRVIPAMHRFLHRLDVLLDEQPLRSWARYRWADLVVSIDWLYDRTGEGWLLPLAAKVAEQGFDWRHHFARYPTRWRIVREERDLTTHVVNNAMAIKQPGIWSRQTQDGGDRDASLQMIATLDRYHGQATGVFSGDEHLAGKNPSQGTELCAVVEYMYSLETLLSVLGEPALADRLERIAYNALPATISEDMWTHQYVQQVNQVVCRVSEDRIYTTNGPDANIFGLEPNFGCCTADMHQGWPKLVSHAWMRSSDNGLAALIYLPCTITTEVQGVPITVTVATDYPFDGEVHVVVSAERPVAFPLLLRIPAWATDATIESEEGQSSPVAPGSFHRLTRHWNRRTDVRLRLRPRVRIERHDDGSVSLLRGPLLFAYPIPARWRRIGGEEPHADWEVHPTGPWNYALTLAGDGVVAEATTTRRTVPSRPFSSADTPLAVTVAARQVPAWQIEHNAAGRMPQPPLDTTGQTQEIVLVPYGATKLRVAQFPTVNADEDPPGS